MRVLFSSIGAIGHVYPMLPLAQAFARAGDEVQWACSPDVCPIIEDAGIATVPAGMTMSARQERLAERHTAFATLAPDARTDRMVAFTFGELLAPAMLEDLLPAVRAWRPGLVVHDSMDFAGPIAATVVDAVHVAHSFGPLTPEHRIISISNETTPLWEAADLEPRPYGGLYDHLYLDIYPPSMQGPVGDHVGVRQLLRPMAYPPADDTRLPPGLAHDAGRPLVYVTFGTETPDDRPLRLVIDALAEKPLRLLVTVGNRRDPKAFGAQPANVVIERFVPQTSVLPHAAVVISHGGSGTVLAALAAGLPQPCLPYFVDQPLNARAVSHAGAGLTLDIAGLDCKQLAEAATRLLTEPTFRRGARAVAAEINEMPHPDQVASRLSALGPQA